MAKKKSAGSIPIEAVEEFVRAAGTDLLSNDEIPTDLGRSEYNRLANAILEKRIEIMRKNIAKAGS